MPVKITIVPSRPRKVSVRVLRAPWQQFIAY